LSTSHPVPVLEPREHPADLSRLIEEGQRWERRGHLAAARRRYERALGRLGDGEAAVAADLTRWIGRTFLVEGDLDAAAEHARSSLRIAEDGNVVQAVAHALNLLGACAQHRGVLDEARSLYLSAERHASEAGELSLVTMVRLNLGVIANIQGDLAGALEHYREGLSVAKRIELFDSVIFALNNLGMVLTDLGRWEEARVAFDEALGYCESTGNTGVQVVVAVNRAEMLAEQGAYPDAEEACRSAFRLMRSIDDLRAAGDMFKVQGIIAREREDLEAAERHFERALSHAEERGNLLLAAEVAREQGVLFWNQRRSRDTLVALNRAHQLFDRLRARRDLADIGERMSELEKTFEEIVRLWGESIESADRYTQGHCVRVADHACLLARAYGMDEQTLFWFRLGGLLHDVGKTIVPAEVLNKPGGFTPEERLLMERHPDAGVELLAGIEFPWDIRPMVRFHHERWGGGGYPTGIAGEEIPVAARILAIADVFDALSSDRPYRKALPLERCLEIMRHEMKGFFDPELLALWEDLCARGEVRVDDWRDGGGREAEAAPAGSPLRVLCIPGPGRGVDGWGGRLEGSAGVAVTLCGSLDAAGRLLDEEHFDACLLEIVEAEERETSIVARLREQHPEVALLAVGLGGEEAAALPLIQAGAQELLQPHQLAPASLAHAVRRAIERNRIQQELHNRSTRDDLTGVLNRRGFLAAAQQRMKAAERTGRDLFLLFADVDGMKEINDRHGHAEGDRALVELARLLQQSFRKSDVVARLGGDEFVVLVRESSAPSVSFVTRRLEERVAEAGRASGRPYDLTISLGVTRFDPKAPRSLEELLTEADRAMYARKRHRAPGSVSDSGEDARSVVVV
jgi:diguanylate cyclase (GGDEF)-like protein/putative nucleotidyltransferase with HDIG domain